MGQHHEAVEPSQLLHQSVHPVLGKELFCPVGVSVVEVSVVATGDVQFAHLLAAVLDVAQEVDFAPQEAHRDVGSQLHERFPDLAPVEPLLV